MKTRNNPGIEDKTLLDDFAGKAMQGIRSNEEAMYMIKEIKAKNQTIYECLAEESYEIARNMLKERTKRITT